ncbi:MAG: signal recognition particle protein [Deltaproteobacteria bacterium]|nr:signal recognition particle protein [Deltaproteobacteria bacterium]
MFETLTKGFRAAKARLTGKAELTGDNIDQALRDVRMALLEADVELGVVKRFLGRVKDRTLGKEVALRAEHQGQKALVEPGDHFIQACHDELIAMMSSDDTDLRMAPKGTPTVVMMVGLQGQGKTTTSAKLARLYARDGKKVLLVAADLQRPAAVDQLTVLGQKASVPVFSVPGSTPVEVCRRALVVAKVQKKDLVILDTAGRLAIDTTLMNELAQIKGEVKPQNILLVVNASIGQNALGTAQTFHEMLGLTGVALTMLDGDARGGAALSIREVTGVPIKFAGVGEGIDKLEPFRPDGMASRILGMGDIVGLMKDFTDVVDAKEAERNASKILEGRFTFDDFLEQISTIQRMGPLKELVEKMPFFPEGVPAEANLDDRELDRVKAMIGSMTRQEREDADLFKTQPSRVARVARGSGVKEEQVAELVAKFMMMRDMIGGISKQAGFLSRMPGAKQLAMARKLKQMIEVQGPDAAFNSIAQEMLEAAVAGGGGAAMQDPEGLMKLLMDQQGGRRSAAFGGFGGAGGAPGPVGGDRNKAKRKQERDARKKNRRK